MSDPDLPQRWMFEYIDDDYEPPYFSKNLRVFDASVAKLKDVISMPGEKISFCYDFGDDWNVDLTFEKVFVDKELHGRKFPRALEGEGYGIIEDCGGTRGLAEIAAAFKKKSGSDYKKYSEWLGRKDMDLDTFDLERMDILLRYLALQYWKVYEQYEDDE